MSRHGLGAHVAAGIAAGTLASALVGALETAAVVLHAKAVGVGLTLGWAVAVYGAVGAVAGLGMGLAGGLVARRWIVEPLATYAAVLFLAEAAVIGRFRVVRDLLHERVPHGVVVLAVAGAALALLALVAVVLGRALARMRRSRVALFASPPGAVLLVAAVALVSFALGALPQRAAPRAPVAVGGAKRRPNILLIMVDTLRADHLSCYGAPPGSTPRIDELAADGLRFTAFSQASWTRPSVATILTSLYPSSHGATGKADILPDRVDTLAEALHAGGYRTVGFANNANVSPAFNFQQGYDKYYYLAPDFFFGANEGASQLALYSELRLLRERFLSGRKDVRHYYQPAEVVSARVGAWLEAHGAEEGRPFFLFVHYMDPHDPYFAHPFDGRAYARVANPHPAPSLAAGYREFYDGEVRYLDRYVGVLLDRLRALGLYDRTLIVLTADHGEEFQEHGGWWHGTTLYDEQIHVPLIVKLPGANHLRGRAPRGLATSLDIAPTILSVVGLPVPAMMQGRSLLDGALQRKAVFAEEDFEGNRLQALRTRTWKLMTANPENPRGLKPVELFDLVADPGERYDLAGTRPETANSLAAELAQLARVARAHAGVHEKRAADALTRERLRALGYVN